MSEFVIKTKDGEFTITADDEAKAVQLFNHYQSNNYSGPTDKDGVPEGMVYDKATNRMVDAKALADHTVPGGSWAGDALKGVPFVGEYADEALGYLLSSDDTKNHPNESQDIQTEVARQAQKTFEDQNPKTATASKLAMGLVTLPLALRAGRAIPVSASLGKQALTGATIAGATGALEGAVSGYGEGTDKPKPDLAAYPQGQFQGLLQPGNIDLAKRPVVKNDDGTISTVRSISVESDGKEILIPTVSPDGKILSNEEAVKLFRRTGQHLGVFDNASDADSYAQKLHEAQQSFYENPSDNNRIETAKNRAEVSGILSGLLGGTAPYVAKAAGNVFKGARDYLTTNRALNDIGISRPAADVLSSKLLADDTLGPVGAQRLAKAGDDAMLADAGPTAAGLLDTTIQRSGDAGRIASLAVEKRAGEAASKLNGTMDLILGRPPGINAASKKIYADSAAARNAAYAKAYSKPIDYSAAAGRDVEDVFMRTPDSILGPAIKRANDTMKINRMQNYQIMASIADDGSVLFREMPNVVQADYLKRALNDIAEESKKEGVMSPAGQDAAKLARQLRTALSDAVPEYATASKLGGDAIEEKRALLLGRDLLNPSVTREDVREGLDGIGDAERKQLMLGLRQNIDDRMANVQAAISDPNLDAREAAKALKDMSSRAAREKIVAALGDKRAAPLLAQLDKAQAALALKANVVANSKTFARTETAKQIESMGKDGVINAAMRGEPLQVGKRAWQATTGATEPAEAARQEAIYADIAKFLTGPRGADAATALQRLLDAYQTGELNRQASQTAGRVVSGLVGLPAYQAGTQALQGQK